MRKLNLLLNLLMFVASVFVGGGAIMAASVITPIAEGGATISEGTGTPPEGAFSKGAGEEASPELFMAAVDQRVTKISQMRTPIDQISRRTGRVVKYDSAEVKYYKVGNRPVEGEVKTAISLSTSADRFALDLVDSSMLDISDTVRFKGINGYKSDGTTVDTGVDFVALVIEIDSNGKRVCQPINGGADQIGYPAIAEGTKVLRMGRAGAEFDVKTAVFSNVPRPETQYCQKFMMQVEESTWAKMTKKEVEWNFTDLERDGIEDMKIGMEGSFMFGQRRKFKHAISKDLVYTTGGIYYMVGKKIDLGTLDATTGNVVITDDDLVDITKILFTGPGSGNRRKVGFAGKDALAALSKVKSDNKRIDRPSVEIWDLKFKSFETEFGEILTMYSEMMDIQGKSDEVLVLDPEYMTKGLFKGWSRKAYNLKDLMIRDTNAVVLAEECCLYLTNPNAHAILKLVDGPVSVEGVELNKSTLSVKVGATDATLVASISPVNATNKGVTWSSATEAVATVSSAGVVTGVTEGTAVITVTTVDGSKTDSCTVTVTAASDGD